MLLEPYATLRRELGDFMPADRLIDDPLRTFIYGTDASFYRLVPKLIVFVETEEEVSRSLQLARQHRIPVTFRAAGTSLSGQAITDSVLLMLGWGWRNYRINEDASQITLQPGIIGAWANRYLAPFNRKIGPDPASINTARIGGIAANNASGMCCGIVQNSYQTLAGMRLVLADGSVLDTTDQTSRKSFAESHRDLVNGLAGLGRRTRENPVLAERIRAKFKIKNTTGYSLNALVDFEDPVDILQHLMIGSEGTLGFISEITYRTVEEHPHKASALVFFPDIGTACEAVAILKAEPVAAVELVDRAALHSVEHKPGMPAYLQELPEGAAALLIETRSGNKEVLWKQVGHIERSIAGIETLFPIQFTDQLEEYSRFWNIRKGLFPSVGGMRPIGTSVIIEDVAFPVPRLAEATLDLQALLRHHYYHEAIIFGHALEGNLHFVFTQDFGTQEEVDRYHRFMDEVCELVVNKYDGSLKAEHSTGRNMAPYVELEWGAEAYRLMREIKDLLDPDHILNPGVILNDDPQVHIKNLKPLFPVDPIVDKCIECGFCEPTCPSRALSTTPRQRIVGLREIARLDATGENPGLREALWRHYQYQGVDTCAGDGLCSMACPVDIDTGRMMRKVRSDRAGKAAPRVADWLAHHFAGAAAGTRLFLGGAHLAHTVLGTALMQKLASGARKLSGNRIPLWNPCMPIPASMPKLRSLADTGKPRVVYFPSCATRTMGPARGDPERDSLPIKLDALLRKAGYEVVYPDNCKPLCCGMAFESKGMFGPADAKLREVEQSLLKASRNGKDPVVMDTSPCAFRMTTHLQADFKLWDITAFLHDQVMERLTLQKIPETVALHCTCSTRKLGLEDKLRFIAGACAEKIIIPEDVPCCGWAGDKGFTVPELNASAVGNLRPSLPEECKAGYSTGRNQSPAHLSC